MDTNFVSIFQNTDAPVARGKYLSRIFGIFSEEIFRIWASNQRCPYEDLGRPTLHKRGEKTGHTLDFTLRHKESGKSFVTEQKCDIEYQNYKYLVLSNINQIARHRKPAFRALLEVAKNNPEQQAFVDGKPLIVDGAILIWGSATQEGRNAAISEYKFSNILTMAEIIKDLQDWKCESYRRLIEARRIWSNELFDALVRIEK